MFILVIGDLHIPDRASDLPAKFRKLLTPGKVSQVLCLGNVTTSPRTVAYLKSLSPDFQLVKGEYDENAGIPLSRIVTHGQLRIGIINGYTIIPRGDPLALLAAARQMDVDVLLWGGTHVAEAYALDGKFLVNPGSATGAFSSEWPIEDEIEETEDKNESGENGENAGNEEEEAPTEKLSEMSLKSSDNGVESESGTNTVFGSSAGGSSLFPDDIKVSHRADDLEDEINKAQDEDDAEYEESEETSTDPVPSFCLLDVQGSVCTLFMYSYIDNEVKVDKMSYRKET